MTDEKRFRVYIKTSTTEIIDVEARDLDDATEQAWQETEGEPEGVDEVIELGPVIFYDPNQLVLL